MPINYWIRNGKIRWSTRWSQEEIDAGRTADRMAKQEYFGDRVAAVPPKPRNGPSGRN